MHIIMWWDAFKTSKALVAQNIKNKPPNKQTSYKQTTFYKDRRL